MDTTGLVTFNTEHGEGKHLTTFKIARISIYTILKETLAKMLLFFLKYV